MQEKYYGKNGNVYEVIKLENNDESINYFRDELLWNTKTDLYTTEDGVHIRNFYGSVYYEADKCYLIQGEDWDIKWGEYIVKDKSGEIYIVRPDVFQMFLKRNMK